MKVLFISVWPFDSGIFQSTIPPVVNYWVEHDLVKRVEVVSFGETTKNYSEKDGRILHRTLSTPFLNQAMIRFFFQLIHLFKIALKGHYDLIWARSVTPGNLAYLTSLVSGVPFGVESFEPHTDYMIEGNAWGRNSFKTKIQRFLENKIAKNANVLITVSDKFKAIVEKQFNRKPQTTFSMQCAIDFEKFKFNIHNREKIRDKLSLTADDNVGVYVGKFGDIYYDEETFEYILEGAKHDPKNKFIVITEMMEHAEFQKNRFQIPDDQLIILTLPHEEVPTYLSASDFGICPVKESPSRLFCSPIKTGEYFANGLPVVISRGIGEDSEFIEENKIGKVINFTDPNTFEYSNLTTHNRADIAEDSHPKRSSNVLFSKYLSILDNVFN